MLDKHPTDEGKEFSLGQYITKLKILLGWQLSSYNNGCFLIYLYL
jgi:hypothetical protein